MFLFSKRNCIIKKAIAKTVSAFFDRTPKIYQHFFYGAFDLAPENLVIWYLFETDDDLDKAQEIGLCAELENKNLKMSVYTNQPGVQIYSAHGLGAGADFKGGIKQVKYGAICLEAQTEPNSVNRGVGIYKKGETYTQTTVYKIERKG